MQVIQLTSFNPYVNLSTEYYLLTDPKWADEDLILLWKNANTIVIGRNQNLYAEVNNLLVAENEVAVVRRVSGGGAVFQDYGNICYTFIVRNQRKNFTFQQCLQKIVEFLQSLGIQAQFAGRNDLLIGNRKISGTAVYFHKNDYLIHGTLLFDVDVAKMVSLLTVDQKKLSAKGIASVQARIANLKDYTTLSQKTFEQQLGTYFANLYQVPLQIKNYSNDPVVIDWQVQRFANDAWIYGRDFAFNFQNSIKTEQGILSVQLQTENGLINQIKFYSDGLFNFDLTPYEQLLVNQPYQMKSIANLVAQTDLNPLLEGLNTETLLTLLFNNG